ncbi:insulinase family protein [Alkalimonas collagenimarina]|uniref:Protease 3 n=1 Tax=Alkalimonas collagenimarina TaxID=400390 RepID=A0ABT9GZC5_9GAMM|nr:insulinase family protein [Alkalimonas collagenimarina]MDP4536419.1 insulinase family protein [Alkalimonas collagenimarina]
MTLKNTVIKQSPNDSNHYHYLILDNGLPVLLVQQKDAEKSAAALCIRAGHFDDPEHRQGLAHFTEHMLFLGSRKYPVAGSFQHFINHHGGSHNAWTGTEHSTFFLDIEHSHFAEAIERFADMFQQPLFADSYIDKERQSIEAEFTLKLKDDGRRIYQVHKETVNPKHPFAKFSVGNLQTLADGQEETLRQSLMDFFQRYYIANQMTLVLVSPLGVSEQEQIVQQHFALLPAGECNRDWHHQPLYLPNHLAVELNVQPHKAMHKLVMTFALPGIQHWYPFKLVSFIAHMLGDEGPGSLHFYLKAQGWINQLSAGGGVDGSNFKDFSISCELTQQGLANRQHIIRTVFSYLAMLKQQPFPANLYEERQQLLQWSFLYQEPSTPEQTASELAVNMQHYPVEDIIFGDYRMETPPDHLYRQVLAYFQPENMRLMLISPEVATNQTARWYHTPYAIKPIPTEQLKQWAEAPLLEALHLPPANPYLVNELTLLTADDTQHKPHCYVETTNLKLWFKADGDFHTPKGHIYLQLSLPGSIKDCWHLAATRLWIELVNDEVHQRFYPATTAGLGYSLHVQKQGVSIHSHGLTTNQIQLLHDLLKHLREFAASPSRFDELKLQLLQHWRNSHKNKPVATLFSQLSALLHPLNPAIEQLATELESMKFADFTLFARSLLQQVHIEGLMIGNWQPDDADSLQQQLQHWLHEQPKVELPVVTERSLQGRGPVWLHTPVEHHDHALVIYLPAQEKSAEHMAHFMLANHLLAPQYFHQLRTEEQLGYLVGTGYVPVNTMPGLAFYIQSPKADCPHLYQSTLAFYRSFLAELETLSELEFSELKQGLLSQLQEKDTSLSSRAKRLWLAIGQDDHSFDLTLRITHAVELLTLERFIHFFYQLLSPDYDAVFLATDGKPTHSHLRFLNPEQFERELSENL